MAVLGKRKSRDSDSSDGVSALDAEAIFRRHFEAQFEPLDDDQAGPARTRREHVDDNDDDNDSELEDDDDEEDDSDEWGGFSGAEGGGNDSEDDSEDDGDDGEAPAVQVIDHSKPQVYKEPKMSKKELRAFMSSKVIDPSAPRTSSSTSTAAAASKPDATLPEDAPSLLAQDLELRRLLSESHLFTPSHNNAASASVFASSVVHGTPSAAAKPFSEGRTRLKATELRLQALGAKKTQDQRMPMNMRKGVVAKAEAREAKRRREAKENGVILERIAGGGKGGKGKTKSSRGRQERGVNGPGIGRMRGAELRISESDVRKIEGSRDAFSRRGRR